MIGNHKLVVDAFCEVKDFVRPWQDLEFYNFAEIPSIDLTRYIYLIKLTR